MPETSVPVMLAAQRQSSRLAAGSTRWIADASVEVFKKHRPSLTLVYLPHLDYVLRAIDRAQPKLRDRGLEPRLDGGRVLDALAALERGDRRGLGEGHEPRDRRDPNRIGGLGKRALELFARVRRVAPTELEELPDPDARVRRAWTFGERVVWPDEGQRQDRA